VFFTPAVISGTAKMKHGQFIVWNLVASLGFSLAVGASAYGLGRIASGNHSARDLLLLLVGIGAGAVLMIRSVRRRRGRAATSPSPR
jgi:membrane protein DedA with SNARE-associated domain